MSARWVLGCALSAWLATTAVPASNATLTFHFTNRGLPLEDPLQARFYVYAPDDDETYVAWGHAARPAIVPEGVYNVVIKYVNGGVTWQQVLANLELRGEVVREVDFDLAVARLSIAITSGGVAVPRFAGSFNLHRPGERGTPLLSLRPGETAIVAPGRYDIEVLYRGSDELESKWLLGYSLEGEQQEVVEVGAAQARLGLTLLDSGRPLPREVAVWRVFHTGSREGAIVEGRSGESRELPPGVYDIGLFWRTGTEAAERWLADVEVRGAVEREIDVGARTDRVTVHVRNRGSREADAWFALYAPGEHERELYSGASGEAVEVRPGTYDIGCFVRRGGLSGERWFEGQAVSGPVELEADLDLVEASLRVRPATSRGKGKDEGAKQGPNLLLVVDSSAGMSAALDGRPRLEQLRETLGAAIDSLVGTDTGVGLRVFGIAPLEQEQCNDSTLLVPAGRLDRRALTRSLDMLRPTGKAPIARSLELAPGDLRSSGQRFVLLIAGGGDSCGGDVCAAAARAVREGGLSRIYVVELGGGHDLRRGLDCAGDVRVVRSKLDLDAALRDVLREVRRGGEGSVSVFSPGFSRLVASGPLLERIVVAEGTYDVLVRVGNETWTWPDVKLRGAVDATAGPRAPR